MFGILQGIIGSDNSMTIAEFKRIIDNAKYKGTVIGSYIGRIADTEFMICDCGGDPKGCYTAFLFDDSAIEKHYSSFEDAINRFVVNGKTIIQQIDKMDSFSFLEYVD